MKEKINNELADITFHFDMEKVVSMKKKKHIRHNLLFLAIGVALLGTTVRAGYTLYNSSLQINGEELPELDSMKKIEVNLLSEEYKIGIDYEKQYDSYESLQTELGIELLHTEMADNNPYMLITRETDNENWTQIKCVAYIVGDITEMQRIEGKKLYTWISGKEFFSPIDLTVDLISSQKQLESGWNKEYLGSYDFVESYQTRDGYKVNILKSGESNSQPFYQAVFVVDGIRYTVRGIVDIELLKSILNSFSYSTSKTNEQGKLTVWDDDEFTCDNMEEQYDLSDLLYRQNPYKLGKTYAKGTVSIYNNDLLFKTDTPQKIIVVFNDEFLQALEVSGEITDYKVEKGGCYGFYVQDSAGAIYDINDIVYITQHTILED